MLVRTVANAISFLCLIGNTPALNLARGLPHGINGALLLLSCGDARNILHTAYHEVGLPDRKFDITCNDYDEAILARNTLLFSLLLDNKISGNTPWNLYYNLDLSKSDLKLFSGQLKKLLASIYGKLLPFCDQATFDDVRAVWKSYDASASADVDASSAALKINLKQSMGIREITYGKTAQSMTVANGTLSAAPVSMQNSQDILKASESFWKSAPAGASESADIPNPMFAASLSKHRVLHYGTDPILGFHLATAYVGLTKSSPLRPDQKDDKLKAFAAAKTQFR